MISRYALAVLAFAAAFATAGRVIADEPTSPSTTPTSPSTSVPVHKPQATNIINGKVEKITDSTITLKVTFQTMSGGKVIPGRPTGGHTSPARISGHWLPHLVPPHVTLRTPPRVIPGKIHTSVQTLTFNLQDVTPVKVFTPGSKPTRETGSMADIRPGDLAMVGLGPVKTTNADGKPTTRTLVTGIDVMHNPNASAANNKPNKPAKPKQNNN